MDIKSEAVSQFLRMRKWVLTQPMNEKPNIMLMRKSILEDWDGDKDPYCRYRDFIMKDRDSYFRDKVNCPNCLLSNEKLKGASDCCNGLWRGFAHSLTWAEWLKVWEQVVYYICVFG